MSFISILLLSGLINVSSAIPILDFDTTSIPYLIPRCFQTTCDRSDEFLPDFNNQIDPLFYISSTTLRSKPSVWTHEPFCLESLSANKGFCVYSSSTFSHGRGISIVASPLEASRIITAPALQSRSSTPQNPHASKFEIKPIPGRGLGIVATAPLYRGDQLYSLTPIIAVQDDAMQFLPVPDLLLLMAISLSRLPFKTQAQFWTMHAQFGGNAIYDRITTNAYNMPLGSALEHFWAAQPEISRINHDCRPNAANHFDAGALMQNVHVLRPIGVGEEVTVSYLTPLLGYEERKKRIAKQWGFECTCSLCASTESFRNASDDRLGVMADLEARLDDIAATRTGSTGMAELLIALYELERLDGAVADGYMYAALEYAYIGDVNAARKYAARAMEATALWRGTTHPYYRSLRTLWESPEAHKSWMYTKKVKNEEMRKNAESLTQMIRGLTEVVRNFEKAAPRLGFVARMAGMVLPKRGR